jgi:hypothetical protein
LHVCDLLPNLTRDMADQYFRRFETDGTQFPLSDTAVVKLWNGTRLPVELLGSPYFERGRLFAWCNCWISVNAKKGRFAVPGGPHRPGHRLSSTATRCRPAGAGTGQGRPRWPRMRGPVH